MTPADDRGAPAALRKTLRALDRLEAWLLVALLLGMILVAVYQVVARNVFGGGLMWGDSMVRISVLWVTMLGAASAAGSNTHINIDILERFAKPGLKAVTVRLTSLFAAVMCGALAYYSIEFISWDYADGTIGFGVVPVWLLEAIIPVGGALMALKYLLHTVWPP